MITQIKSNSNLSFKSNMAPVAISNIAQQNNMQNTADNFVENEENKKTTLTQKCMNVKRGATNVVKKFNNFFGVTTGAVQGAVTGLGAAGAIGIIGKNWKNGNGEIIPTFAGIIKDVWSAIKVVPNALWSTINKSPIENVKLLGKKALSGIKTVAGGLKKHPLTALVAGATGATIFVANIINAKIKANSKNASLDHKTNQGHI